MSDPSTEHAISAQSTRTTRQVIVRSASLGGSPFSRALRDEAHPSGVHALLERAPRSPDEWRERVHATRGDPGVHGWFDRLAPAFGFTDAGAAEARATPMSDHGTPHGERIEANRELGPSAAVTRLALAAAGGVVITTGQQPGLFGGPGYTWTKAMSALALADELQATIGVPVAPVFWAATDDADWRETATTYLLRRDGLTTVSLEGEGTDGIPVSEVLLGPMEHALRELRRSAGSAASSEIVELVERAYTSTGTIGDAYVTLLRALLEPLGVAVIDASHPALRTASDGVLRSALVNGQRVNEALLERSTAIRDAGFAPQVDVMDALSLVFESTTGAKGRTAEESRGPTSKTRVPLRDASERAVRAGAGTLGANVLLRPIVERCVLPTVAYVAGPGEYAYFAQTSAVASALGVVQPLALPRWSGEVIEAHSDEQRRSLSIDESALADLHSLEGTLARRTVGDEVTDALERLRVTIETQSGALRAAATTDDDLVPPSVVDGLQRALAHRVDRFERRAVAAAKRREHEMMANIAHVRAAFRPLGQSPERVLNLLPFFARFGTALLDELRDAARPHARALIAGSSLSS